jgi:uncharacterized membrane protein
MAAPDVLKFFHLAAALAWMGGMLFMIAALRPALALLDGPSRLALVAAVLSRFLPIVGISIAVIAVTGAWLFAQADARPYGWHAMAALGGLMMLIAGHLAFAPYRRLKRAVAAQDWPAAAGAAAQVTRLAQVNLALGTAAIAAVMLWR